MPMMQCRIMLARLLPDFGPAREYPAFRRLLAGGLLSMPGRDPG